MRKKRLFYVCPNFSPTLTNNSWGGAPGMKQKAISGYLMSYTYVCIHEDIELVGKNIFYVVFT
jgi:hypothetical protein